MTQEYSRFVESSTAAERAGDAETALEFHRGVPMFARGRHLSILTQLADLSGEMTPWLWARWAAYQCLRAEDLDSATGQIQRSALDYTVRMFYADRIEDAYLNGHDPMQLLASVCGESWLFQQQCTHDFGGLESFLEEVASGRLREASLLARAWVGTRMGGYRVVPGSGLVVRDLRSGQDLRLLDLGAGHVGEFLIGRLVSSGTTPELMFDTRPVEVDSRTAREVATARTPGGWVSAVKAALDDKRLERERFESEDLEIASDVPGLRLLEVGTSPRALASTRESLARGRDEIGRSAFRILGRVAQGSFGPDSMAAYVGAAVLNPHGHTEAMSQLAATGDPETWAHWAGLVAEPARARLLRLAGLAAAA